MHKFGRSSGRALASRALRSSTEALSGTAQPTATATMRERMRIRVRIRQLFLRFDGNQAMPCLPLLVRILPICHLQEEMIIGSGFLIFTHVIVGGRAQEVTDGNLG